MDTARAVGDRVGSFWEGIRSAEHAVTTGSAGVFGTPDEAFGVKGRMTGNRNDLKAPDTG